MGFLSLGKYSIARPPIRLPRGSFTVDRTGRIFASTVSRSFPVEMVERIGRMILTSFREARASGIEIQELQVHYAAFRLSARYLHGGALVFLMPKEFGK